MPNRKSSKVTIYNISKKLVKVPETYRGAYEIRFKYPEAFDGYAGAKVAGADFVESANPNFWHAQMPETEKVTLTYKTGIRKDDVETKEITPRELKSLFEATRSPRKRPEPGQRRNARPSGQPHNRQFDENTVDGVFNRDTAFGVPGPDEDMPF